MIISFPKIFALGTRYLEGIFDNDVEITEKIDGSQFNFGKIDGQLYARSKGQEQNLEAPDKMFQIAIDYVKSVEDKIRDDTMYFCEYLNKPKHNILKYERVPKNNLILFGVSDKSGTYFTKSHSELEAYANELDIEVIPLISYGKVDQVENIKNFMEQDSVLGGVKIEGLVVKNYEKEVLVGGYILPLMIGKYVSEKFKEVHRENWGKLHTARGGWQLFVESFKTEARWHKAVQHLTEKGELENTPKDIGALMKEIERDVVEEEEQNIKEFLWKEFHGDIIRKARGGFPEWYKEQLLDKSFKE